MRMEKPFKKKAGFGTAGIIIGISAVAAAVVFILLYQAQKKGPIKIGAVLSITGAGSYSGKEVRDGMLLAVDEINAWGGINGREIEPVIEDAKTDKQEGRKAFKKLEDKHHPALFISTLSSVSMAVAPLAEENQVPLIGLVAAIPKLTAEKEWVFRYFPKAAAEVKPIMVVLQELRVKELGIMYQDDEYGTSVYEFLKNRFKKSGGAVRGSSFEPDEQNFKEQIATLRGTEAIYIVGFSPQLVTIFKQLQEENFDGTILASSGATFPSIRSMPEAKGTFVAAPIIYNPDFLFAQEVKDKYEERYGKPFNHYAANGYDFIKILAGLLEDQEISRKSIKKLMEEGFLYNGVFGSIEVELGEHDIIIPLHPAQIVEGGLEYWW